MTASSLHVASSSQTAGVSVNDVKKWAGIDWDKARREAGGLQMRIAKPEAFFLIDIFVFERLWRMTKRRYQKKSKEWLIHKC